WLDVFANISPYMLAHMGTLLSLVLCVIGAGWGIFLTGTSIMGEGNRAPALARWRAYPVGGCALPGRGAAPLGLPAIGSASSRRPIAASPSRRNAVAIFGVIVSLVMSGRLQASATTDGNPPPGFDVAQFHYAGYSLFSAGLSCGISNLASGVCVGIAGSSCVLADAQNKSLFSPLLLVEVFGARAAAVADAPGPAAPVAIGLFGLIVSVLQIGQAYFPGTAA
ncbi:ATP6V0B, partial [Symbiodinium sp. KB8]